MTDIDRLITTADDQQRVNFDWGELVWADSTELTGTDSLTIGKVTIETGQRNPEHCHPNCDEALYMLSGTLRHTIGDKERELEAGDLIHIPRGSRHRAVNDGDEDAIAVIAYDTGEREFELVE